MSKKLEVTATIHKPIDQVWEIWTQPQHIIQWNAANEDWHTPSAENDLQEGGTFNFPVRNINYMKSHINIF